MKKTSLAFCVLAALTVVALRAGADPGFLVPSVPGVVHLDLNPLGQYDVIPGGGGVPALPNPVVGGPSGVFPGGEWVAFSDNLNAPAQPYNWETELYNPNATTMVFTAGWYWPGGSAAYSLTLPPGGSFYLNVITPETPETANWSWGCASGLNQSIGVDTSIVENGGNPGLYAVFSSGTQSQPITPTGTEDLPMGGGQKSPRVANVLPPPTAVCGKEYSDRVDTDALGLIDPLQNVWFKGNGAAANTWDYSGSGPHDLAEVDALANRRDALYWPLVQDMVPMLVSHAGYNDIRYQMAKADINGVWCTAQQINQAAPPKDVDALEVWQPLGEEDSPLADDADMFSLLGDPGGVAVFQYNVAANVSVAYITTAALQAAIGTQELIDLDALMVWDTNGDDQFGPGDSITFSIVETLSKGGVFDGGEIWVWNFGNPAIFLVHGGEVWNTAHTVALDWGVTTEDIDALEAVPEPATLSLLALGGLALIRRRRAA